MSQLLLMPWVLGPAAFMTGYVLARLASALGGRRRASASSGDTDRDRHYRAMEAELRVTRRKLEEAQEAVQTRDGQVAELRERVRELESASEEQTTTIELVRSELQQECAKTRKLRDELSHRAEETIRLEVRARDAETELSLVNSGALVIDDEIARLAAERDELDTRLKALRGEKSGTG